MLSTDSIFNVLRAFILNGLSDFICLSISKKVPDIYISPSVLNDCSGELNDVISNLVNLPIEGSSVPISVLLIVLSIMSTSFNSSLIPGFISITSHISLLQVIFESVFSDFPKTNSLALKLNVLNADFF